MESAFPGSLIPGKRLGKLPKKHDPRTLRLASYVARKALPKPKASVDWGKKTQTWPMLLNDSLGDCTCAAALHMEQAWRDNIGGQLSVTDAEALEAYERVCAYNPADPNSDTGGIELNVLNAWRNQGIGGRKIKAFVEVHQVTNDLVKLAVEWFGGLYIGVALPLAAQNQDVWAVVGRLGGLSGENAPGSWGGHAICIVAYDEHSLTCITWGARKKMTWHWFNSYCDESYAIISDDWLNSLGKNPSGLNLATLTDDLKVVTG